MRKVAAHATNDHGLKEISPELAARVKAAITDEVRTPTS
jgi:predicted small metal-binding protein